MRRVLPLVLVSLLAVAICPVASSAQVKNRRRVTFTAPVERVIDGDTLEVTDRGGTRRIQLYSVDCPERGQPFSKEATTLTRSLVEGQTVTIKIKAKKLDPYGRTVAEVVLPDGRSVSAELARAGLGWYYRRLARDAAVAKLEREARRAKRGLWADAHPVAPWVWRCEHHIGLCRRAHGRVARVDAQSLASGQMRRGNRYLATDG